MSVYVNILCMTHVVFYNIFLFYKIDNHFQVKKKS